MSKAQQRVGLAVALAAGALLAQTALAQAPPPGVFAEIQTAVVAPVSPALEPDTVRSRVVRVDTQKITAARRGREALKLNLFQDEIVEVQIKRVRPTRNGYFISGTPKGMNWGEVRLVVNGPIMVGTVVTPERMFTIGFGGAGRHVIRQIDAAKESFECEVEAATVAGPTPQQPDLPAISSLDPVPAGEFSPPNQAEATPTEDGSEVRMLVVYTQALQAKQGGAAAMSALIDLLFQSANQAFEDGGINPRLVLAHAAMVDLDAEGAPNPNEALRRLRSPDDGYADEVHALRNEHAADLVHLLTDWGPQGYATAPRSVSLSNENFAAFAASGITFPGTSSERIFTHETGHMLGLLHDRYVHGTGAYPYAYGYINKRAFESGAPESAAWHTIMAYNSRCRDADIFCRPIFRFSNPDQTFGGDPLGVPADSTVRGPDGPADARLTINNIARWVGSYRSEACTDFTISSQPLVASAAGGEVIVQVDTAPGCLWESSGGGGFLEITSDLLSAGPGFVRIELEANTTGAERDTSLIIAGNRLTVRQLATDAGICGRTYAVAEALAEAAGYSGIAECEQVMEADLSLVESLDFRNQGISNLKTGDFEGLSGLQSLSLASNTLDRLPDGIFRGLSSLEVLDLSENRLTRLPEGLLTGLSDVVEVRLQFNRLNALPATLFAGITDLKALDLRNNELTTLPATLLAGLANLTELNLGYNQLSALPESVFAGLSKLEDLNLRENRLAELQPELFAGLTTLRDLDLYANRLVDISNSLHSDLANLGTLELGHNRLPRVSKEDFDNVPNLWYLSLQNNELLELPARLFSGLPNLKTLNLKANRLYEFPPEVLEGVAGLRELNLSINYIHNLQAETFARLSTLTTLDLKDNELSSIPQGIFSELRNLQFLVLNNNDLRQLDDGVFAGLKRLIALDIRFNPGYPLPLNISLEKVGEDSFKAVAAAGAPFEIDLPVSLSSSGSIDGSVDNITIPAGATESGPISVSRVEEAPEAVSVNLGELPEVPPNHRGYLLNKDEDLPLRILPSLLSTDALLVDLAVDGRMPEPDFDADTKEYAIVVANQVATVTVTPTTSNAAASVEFLDAENGSLPDADSATQGHQASLRVGENNMKVRVTSADGTTTEDYTLTVTRDTAANVCVRTQQVRDELIEIARNVENCSEMTDAHLAEIRSLVLRGSGLESLKSGDFAGLKNVTDLALDSNGLTRLPADLFADLTALETLYLNENRLSALESGVFSGLSALRVLALSRNELVEFRADHFSDLRALEELWLYDNQLTSLPVDLFSAVRGLRVLFLSDNALRGVPAELFSGLSELEELHLGGNLLQSLPEDLFVGLSALERLELSLNRLGQLPPGIFSDLNALESLDLVLNGLESLPVDAFSDLAALRELRLGANLLQSLPADIFVGLNALENLELGRNRLTSLPDGIFVGLSKMRQLRLEENKLDPLPLTISLQKVGDDQFRAVVPTGVPFTASYPYIVRGPGTTENDLGIVTVPIGSADSQPIKVTRVEGTIEEVEVDFGDPPALPDAHSGYRFEKDPSLPRVILPGPKDSPPAAATGVEVTAGVEQMEVSWSEVLDADGYKVQWKSGDEGYADDRQALVSGGDSLSYTITGLTAGTEYTVRVIATKASADDGPPSGEVTGTPSAVSASQVQDVSVTVGVGQLEVSWAAVPDANGYSVQWKSGAEDYADTRQSTVSGSETITYTITGLTAGTEYTIRVIATGDGVEDGAPSSEVTGTPRSAAPVQVTGVALDSGPEQLEVSWDAVSEANGYKVQWKSGTEDYADERQGLVTAGDSTTYAITGLTPGTEYTVRVIATKEHADDGEPSAEVTGIPKATSPARVTGVAVEPGLEELDVSWDAVSDADGYKVQWKSGTQDYDGALQGVVSGGDTVSYTITDLTADTEYTLRVIATRKHADDGEPSEEVMATPLSANPDVNGDGTLDGNDALIMYHSYASEDRVGDGETGGTAESRQSLLAGYSAKTNPTDDELKEMIRKALAWQEVGVEAGGDINEDGEIDEEDAYVMYHAYANANLVGDGTTGGTARFRQLLLAAFAGKENPTDEDLKAMLRRANKMRDDFG